jgi:2',3'-cyclic-nucleotide 2'-phosphodiesterase (5'-nucleotidase family)
VTKIEGKKIGVKDKQSAVPEIENYIKPFREHIDKDLNEVLAYCPENLDKSKGELQTNIGCFLADITLEKSNPIFLKRENKKIDVCILNHGGIRTILPKGDVTARNAYEVMPFENSAVVVGLKKEQIIAIANYIISEKKPHPLSGMTFTISKDKQPINILVQGKPLEENTIYYVVTSDYLSNGGDNMEFFKQNVERHDLNYKLRNIMIDYFKDVDTLVINKDIRITKE